MPLMNGLGFIENLRKGAAGQKHKDIPIVVLTGHSDAENLKSAVSLGIQGYLVKPISPATLEKRITTCIGAPTIDPRILGNGNS